MKTTNAKKKGIHTVGSNKSADFEAFVNAPSTRCIKPCVTCKAGDEVVTWIRQFMQKRIEGKTRKRTTEFREWLTQQYGYRYKNATLSRHMRLCEPDLYRQMRKADIRFRMALGPAKMDTELGRGEHPNG